MDWSGFVNILKKADLNSLMLSAAITGWIMIYFQIDIFLFGIACFASCYCIIRFVVYIYQYISVKRANKRYDAQIKKEKEDKEAEQKEARNIEICRMFEGLKEESKNILADVFIKGKRDSRNYNVLHFNRYSNESSNLSQAVYVSKIFRDAMGYGQDCIWIRHYTDTLTATIDPYLYDLIKKYIEENGLELKNQ